MATCQVDFYVLKRPGMDAASFACALAARAWGEGNRVKVLAGDPAQAEAIDERLWAYPNGRFVPHARTGSAGAAAAPVTIALPDSLEDGGLVINLGPQALPDPGRFDRLLEIVPQDPAALAASREKFRHYLGLGLKPEHHEIS